MACRSTSLKIWVLTLACGLAGLSTVRATPPDTTPIAHVDLPRYMGRWYVISHTPNFLEKHKVGTSDNYTLRPDGGIDVIFVFRKSTLDAPEKQWKAKGKVLNAPANSEWTVRFFSLINASYHVVDLDPEYRWVAASTKSGELLWIMSRTPTLDDGIYQAIVQRMKAKGFAVEKLEKVPQAGP
jgi:apolipoprotein D and lipocalin family protein